MKAIYLLLILVLLAFFVVSIVGDVLAAPPVVSLPRAPSGGGGGGGGFDPNCPWLTVGGSVEAEPVTKIYESDINSSGNGDNPCFPGQLRYKDATGNVFIRNDVCDTDLIRLHEYYYIEEGGVGKAKIHDYACTNGCAFTPYSHFGYCKP